jgi:hypothetical protein
MRAAGRAPRERRPRRGGDARAGRGAGGGSHSRPAAGRRARALVAAGRSPAELCRARQPSQPDHPAGAGARGSVVVCDRFMDSTTAYQGHAGGVDLEFLASLERAVVGETRPQLTIVFDVDPELGLERARQRDPGHADRFERMGLAFHQRLRAGFLEIAGAEPNAAWWSMPRAKGTTWRAPSGMRLPPASPADIEIAHEGHRGSARDQSSAPDPAPAGP